MKWKTQGRVGPVPVHPLVGDSQGASLLILTITPKIEIQWINTEAHSEIHPIWLKLVFTRLPSPKVVPSYPWGKGWPPIRGIWDLNIHKVTEYLLIIWEDMLHQKHVLASWSEMWVNIYEVPQSFNWKLPEATTGCYWRAYHSKKIKIFAFNVFKTSHHFVRKTKTLSLRLNCTAFLIPKRIIGVIEHNIEVFGCKWKSFF